MFDLNNLKEVNDTLGHAAGDSMIANFAHILRKVVPEKDFVGRYGGDEFIAILYDTTSAQAPLTAAVLDNPQQFGLFAPRAAALDALAGIDPDELTPKQALEALYRLKALG